MIPQPAQPYFSPREMDLLPMSEPMAAYCTIHSEGEYIYRVDTKGERWRLEWDRRGFWCKRLFLGY